MLTSVLTSDPSLNYCGENLCSNLPGTCICACPKGYIGDGLKNGEGCVRDQLLVIEVVVGKFERKIETLDLPLVVSKYMDRFSYILPSVF